MDVTTLATTAVSMLSPYLALAAGAAAEKAGESMMEGAGRLYRWLQDKLTGERVSEALEDLHAQPRDADVQAALRLQLRKALEAEPSLAKELAALLGELTPQRASVTQKQHFSGDGNIGVQIAGNGSMVNIR